MNDVFNRTDHYITKQIIALGSIIFLLVTLNSCKNNKLDKYESNWVVIKYDRNGIDEKDNISFANFGINPVFNQCTPMSVYLDEITKTKIISSVVEFKVRDGKDYILIKDHPYFAGEYLIKCMNKLCCTISLSNDSVYLEMDYNGPYFHGKSRNCPKPRFGLNQE